MYDGIGESFSNSLVLWSVIHSLYTFHMEWSRKVCRDFRYYSAEELIEVVFPTSVVSQSVAVTLITDKITEIKVIHTEVGEPFLYGQSLAEHHQTSHREPLLAGCPINDITAKIFEKRFVIGFIPHVTIISKLEQGTVTVKRIKVDVIHIIVFQQHSVVSVLKRVSYHRPHLPFCAMVIAFVVSSVSSLIHITIQINGLYPPIGLRNVDAYYLHTVYLDRFHIAAGKDVLIYFITIDGVPEVIDNLLCIIYTNDLKTFLFV